MLHDGSVVRTLAAAARRRRKSRRVMIYPRMTPGARVAMRCPPQSFCLKSPTAVLRMQLTR